MTQPFHFAAENCRKPRRRKQARRLLLEPLENRHLLAVMTVDTELDVVADDGLTSLREAIIEANALPGADRIVFDFGHDEPVTIPLENGELEVTESLTITGLGPDLLTIDAQQHSRIFNVASEYGMYVLEGMALAGGQTDGSGGAILSRSSGVLTIEDCVLANNHAGARDLMSGGGAVYSTSRDGTVSVIDSVITRNSTGSSGGGISGYAELFVAGSTISENSADFRGGGICAFGGAAITNSTISGNSATSYVGGILSPGASISNSTIVWNTAKNGGGISADGGTVTNSIIALNYAGEAESDVRPTLDSTRDSRASRSRAGRPMETVVPSSQLRQRTWSLTTAC